MSAQEESPRKTLPVPPVRYLPKPPQRAIPKGGFSSRGGYVRGSSTNLRPARGPQRPLPTLIAPPTRALPTLSPRGTPPNRGTPPTRVLPSRVLPSKPVALPPRPVAVQKPIIPPKVASSLKMIAPPKSIPPKPIVANNVTPPTDLPPKPPIAAIPAAMVAPISKPPASPAPIPIEKPVSHPSPVPSFVSSPSISTLAVSNYKGEDLTDIVLRGDIEAVKKAIKDGAPIDKPDEYGNTALCVAASEGLLSIAEYLLAEGSFPDAKGLDGKTPLHIAVFYDKKNIVQLFTNVFKDRNQYEYLTLPDDNGDTPLHTAVMLGRDEYFELLILAGAEVSYPNANGESAFVSGNKHQQNLITRCCKLAYKNIIHDIPGCETDKETSIFEKIKNGNTNAVAVLSDVNEQDSAGNSLLAIAVQSFDENITALLIKKQANINQGCSREPKQSPLHISVMNGNENIAQLLINSNANIDIQDTYGKTALHYAAEWKKTNIASLLIQNNANLEIVDNDGRTPLHQAAICGRAPIVSMLLEHGANTEKKDKDGLTPLHLATMWNWDKAIMELVTKGGASIEEKTPEGLYPLHVAVKWKKIRSIKALLELNADPLVMNLDGYTPIHFARKTKNDEIISLFTSDTPESDNAENETAIKMKDEKMNAKLIKATKKGSMSVIEDLFENYSFSEEIIQEVLFSAARTGKDEVMEQILENSEIDLPSCIDENGQTLLHAAVLGNNESIVEELLNEEVPVNAVDNNQKTAIQLAITKPNMQPNILKLLCSHGADLGVVDENGDSLLHLVYSSRLPDQKLTERVNILLERMTVDHLNIANNNGLTVLLQVSSQHECSDSILDVIKAGAEVNYIDSEGLSAICWAAKRDHVNLTKYLLYYGAIIEDQEKLFATASRRIVDEILDFQEEMAQRATQSGGDCDNSQVFAWAENGNSDEIYSWLENGGNVHVMDEYSSIPLHLASLCGHADIVQALVEYNSDVNLPDCNLQTPLHLAAMKGHESVIEILLQYQADPNVYDSEDQAPIDWATLLGHDGIVSMLS